MKHCHHLTAHRPCYRNFPPPQANQPTPMRLSQPERDAIKQAAQESFEPGVVVRLFGSRALQDSRGGDIDLLIETQLHDPASIARAHTRFLSSLYARLGEQKIDVLIDYPKRRQRPAIFDLARAQGVVL